MKKNNFINRTIRHGLLGLILAMPISGCQNTSKEKDTINGNTTETIEGIPLSSFYSPITFRHPAPAEYISFVILDGDKKYLCNCTNDVNLEGRAFKRYMNANSILLAAQKNGDKVKVTGFHRSGEFQADSIEGLGYKIDLKLKK
jgi:hypothetical protein